MFDSFFWGLGETVRKLFGESIYFGNVSSIFNGLYGFINDLIKATDHA